MLIDAMLTKKKTCSLLKEVHPVAAMVSFLVQIIGDDTSMKSCARGALRLYLERIAVPATLASHCQLCFFVSISSISI